MQLAGIEIRDGLVLELARLVDDPVLAGRLDYAYVNGTEIVGLTIDERETIIRALADPPRGLEELRGVLLVEHAGRKRDGLA